MVCTEQVEIHPTSEITPFIELRLWDDQDIPGLARMSEAIHRHGALAGIELAYNGMNGPNLYSREVPMGPSHLPIATFTADPVQARAMDKEDIADLRRWHRQAALRAQSAGFDIVYVYAAHGFGTLQHFLSRRYNTRSDEYGGSLVNRVRLLREIIEDTKEAVGERCAVAVRVTVDELIGPAGVHKEEMAEIIGLLAELPDLWDFVLGGWDNDSQTSRFSEEGNQEPYIAGLKSLTSKPVVGVGRFTSPDAMVRQIRKGLLDLIGAARPSIADPFLPRKIEEGRIEDIRECIGCNICIIRRYDHVADPLHPEPDHGGGMAPRLASRTHRPQAQRQRHPRGGGRAGRARMRPRPGAAGLSGDPGGSRQPSSAAGSPANAGCPMPAPGAGCATIACSSLPSCRRSRSSGRAGSMPIRSSTSAILIWSSPPAPIGGGTALHAITWNPFLWARAHGS